MNTCPTTSYLPLTSPSGIRLLLLQPGPVGSPIECSLVHTEIGKQSYEALSYEWGTQQPNERAIYISDDPPQTRKSLYEGLSQFILYAWGMEQSNEQRMKTPSTSRQIRNNLHDALLRIRLRNKTRWLWVDALCINQADNRERTHQVGMMGTIYQSAKRVIAWLGDGNEHDILAIRTFRRIIAFSRKGKPIKHVENHEDPDNKDNRIDLQETQAIAEWGAKSYWHRVWIVQELFLAQDLIVTVGGESISGKELDLIMIAFESWPVFDNFAFQLFLARQASLAASLIVKGPGGMTLCDWILRCRDSECSDPRDRVYGMLGISEDLVKLEDSQLAIEADYDKSFLELYCEVARFWAAQYGRSIAYDS
ncbi:hypothetical protein EG329_014205 [Mollisiaceae sp. DMI_Dod_QoI]|nr:hypothetical protein EG329_014205 [Helotiales sp. DMI_Dod_QoI]